MNTQVGNKIRTLRKSKGLSQEQTAEYLHISQSSYARIENGESNTWATLIEPICELFEIEPDELVKTDTVIICKDQMGGNSNNAYIINQLSEKLIENFERQINNYENQLNELKQRLLKSEEEKREFMHLFIEKMEILIEKVNQK